jgi:hypothetical protein
MLLAIWGGTSGGASVTFGLGDPEGSTVGDSDNRAGLARSVAPVTAAKVAVALFPVAIVLASPTV